MTTLLETPRLGRKVAVFWALAWVGNLMGAMVTAELVAVAQVRGGRRHCCGTSFP